MCCHPGFVVPFRGHKQNIFGIIVKDPRSFVMINGNWFHLKFTGCMSPSWESQPVLWSFDARPWLFLAMKVLDGIFFQQKAASPTLETCCSHATFLNISAGSSGELTAAPMSEPADSLSLSHLRMPSFLPFQGPASASFRLFFCTFLTSLALHRVEGS